MINNNSILFSQIGGDSLTKIGMYQCAGVQNLGQAKFTKKPNAPQNSAKKPMTRQVFMNFRVQTSEFFSKWGSFVYSSIKYYTFLLKITQDLMPRYNLPPKT